MLHASKIAFVGSTADFVKNEILRLGAPIDELRSAIALVGSGPAFDARAYDALSPRMRRLVDLIDVGGSALATSICEASPAEV